MKILALLALLLAHPAFAARSNTGSTSNYLRIASVGTGVTDAPTTYACWIRPYNLTATWPAINLQDATADDALSVSFDGANLYGVDNAVVAACVQGTTIVQFAQTSAIAAANVWRHIAGVFTSTTSRNAYLDGVAGTTSTGSCNPGTLTTTLVGIANDTAYVYPLNGEVAECATWAAALTASEIVSLARGLSPLLVRPVSLVNYWPLYGRVSPEQDLVGSQPLTETGTMAVQPHARIHGRGDR